MNVTNGSEASAGGEASEGATYVLSIYSRLCQDGPPCCTLVVPQGAMATSVLQDAVATLGVGGAEGGGADLYQLVEVREEGGPEFVLEGADRPVERVLLWPPHAQTQHPQSQGYYFLLRSHGDHSHGDGNSDGPFQEQDVDDLCSLSVLSEASILATLRTRFYANQIYTNAGGVLLALNPFCFLPIYNPIHMKLYNGQRPGRLRPHVFAMADRALCAMLHRRSSQAILITGHSGSGKTQTANFLLHCLTALSHKGYANGMKRTILGAGPVLEAFGNAKTAHNDNSSRFCKFVQVNYLESGVVRGAVVQTFLLEQSRVVCRNLPERNFHVFYFLLAGASEEERQELQLLHPEDYLYLTQQGCPMEEDAVLLKHKYKRLKQAMEMVGFLPATRKQIFMVLSAVLHLGNLSYTCRETDTDAGQDVGSSQTLNTLCDLLQVKQELLQEALTRRRATGTLSVPYSQREAVAARDSLAKSLYSTLFDWIVLRINHSLLSKKDIQDSEDSALPQCLAIGVLDICGFEDVKTNSFEQFCINYTNEQLHCYFSQHIFQLEQEDYQAEGLLWQNIDFMDNSSCVDLISSLPSGLLPLLDQESISLQGTGHTLLARFQQEHHGNPFFSATPETEPAFVIQHFAGKVKYLVQDFRAKNRDCVRPSVLALLRRSGRPFVRQLVGLSLVAVFRWGVVRAVIHSMTAFKQAGRHRATKTAALLQRGSRTSIGELRRKSSATVERLQSRSSLLEFSFDRSEEHPLELMEDIFASYESRKRSKGNKQKQLIPKSLIDAPSLRCILGQMLWDCSTTALLNLHHKEQPSSVSAQLQGILCKLLQFLKKTKPVFIHCICSNAEKKEMYFDEALVLAQLQCLDMLETVCIQRDGYSCKYTFQEFTEMFKVLLPEEDGEPQKDILTLLQEMGMDSSTYQIGKSKVFLKELQQQQLQERLQEMRSQELRRKVTLLQRWFQAHQERRHFLQMRAAAITIQRAWRGVREESRYRAATMIQAAWRGSHQRSEYLSQRNKIIKLQALVRASSARRRYRSLQDEQGGVAKDKGVGPVTTSCQRSQEGRELQRQHSLGYDTPPPAQVEGQQAAKLDTLDDTVPARKEGEGLPTQPSLRRYENHSGCKDKKERWKERRSEGALLDSSPDLPSLKDRRTRMLMSQGLSLSLDNVSKLSSSESDSPVSGKTSEEVRVRLRKRPKRKRRLGHVRSGLMFQSGQRDDSEYWTFPLPPISPAPATPPSHSQPDGPHPKPRVQFKSTTETIPDGSKVSQPKRTSSGSSPVTPERTGGFLSRLLKKRVHREPHMAEDPPQTEALSLRGGQGESPYSMLRPSTGRERRSPAIRISRATRVSMQWNASLDREITSASELRHLDEFLGNQVNDLRSRGKQLSGTESIFLTATTAFRETIKGMYSLSKPQIRYKGLMKNYQDKVASLAGQKKKTEVQLVINLFQSVLDGFIRGEMKREEAEPSKPSKKQKKRWSKDKCENILDHTLSTYQVNIMQSCDQCGSYIWGMEKAFMCCSCKMVCHKKCLSKISTDCSTICAKKYDGDSSSLQFGVRVCLLTSSSSPVPTIIEKMLGHVEMNGLYVEGIYRKAGSASRARELHQLLDSDLQSVCLEDYPIHTITSLVKKWLRELPEPLMTFSHYSQFLRATELPEKSDRLRAVYRLLEQLPPAHFNTLERLFFHLVIVAKQEVHNRMSPSSLAIVFAPCLLRSPDNSDPFMSMADVGKTTMCVEMVINEQVKHYNEKMEEIEQLELAEALAVKQLRLRRQNTVLEKTQSAPEFRPPVSDTEERNLVERIKSIKQEKEELACRLPELEQPGSDQDNLDSETSMSCESLMDMRFGNAGAEDGTETSSAPPHQAPPDSQEPLGGCKDVVQSVGITPAKEPSPNNSDPAHKVSRTLSDSTIPYIDEEP